MDYPGRLIAGLIAVILIILFPLQYIAQSYNENVDSWVDEYTKSLSDSIREKGYLDKAMYEEFVKGLDSTNELYDIDMEDIHPITGNDLNGQVSKQEDRNILSNRSLVKVNTGNLSAITNKITMSKLFSLAAHVHSDNCYAGNKHTHSASCYGSCGGTFILDHYADTVDGQGKQIHITVYKCNKCGYTSGAWDYGSYPSVPITKCSNNSVMNCGKTEGVYYDTAGNECLTICNQVVISIAATNLTQTVKQGENILSTATAVYLDGHTGTVNCAVSGYDSNKLGIQTVALTYYGLVDNAKTTGIKTCTVEVTVKSVKTLSSLGVNPASQTMMRFGTPSFTVTAYYSDGTYKTLAKSEYVMSTFDNSLPGPQSMQFSYTEGSITKKVTGTVYIDALSNITVIPKELTVERYTSDSDLPITITTSFLYSGNKTYKSGYQVSGYDPSKLGKQNITISYTDNGITKSNNITVNVTVLHRLCPRCDNIYDFNEDDSDPGCPYCKNAITNISVTPDYMEIAQGSSLPITVNATYADGSKGTVTGWTSNYNKSKTGLQIITIEYGGFAVDITVWVKEATIKCTVCGTDYPASKGKCPVCAEKVISISANPSYVTVNQYDDINLTVTATYTDGHSNQITDWNIDSTSDNPGTFTATVSYKNVSTTITLHVISSTAVVCPICGTVYEPEENPKGCPVCSNLITGIEAYLTSGSNLVQYGATPSIAVVLIFRDTHREITSNGYTIKNYNAYQLGNQKITVKYDIFETTLDIEVVNTLQSVTCPNGHVYYLNEDGTDPGCPYCRITEKVNTVYYFDISYFNEIINKVYKDGNYYFDKGNYLSIIVKKKDLSMLTKMQNMFFRTAFIGSKKRYIYGGEVSL